MPRRTPIVGVLVTAHDPGIRWAGLPAGCRGGDGGAGHELGALDAGVEFAVCLPWFQPLFTAAEIGEAEQRLLLHDFPLRDHLARVERTPPPWVVDRPLTDEDDA